MASGKFRKWLLAALVVIAAVGVAVGIPLYLSYSRHHVSTDDAFVDGRIYYVTPRIGGMLAELLVRDNERVEAGQVVATLDMSELEIDLVIAKHNLRAVKNRTAATVESAAVTQAQAAGLQAQLEYAELEKARVAKLLHSSAVPQSTYDEAYARWKSLAEQLNAADRQRREILVGLGRRKGQDGTAEVELAEAQVRKASEQLEYAVLRAPVGGYVTRKRVEVGQVVAPGQPLFAVVPLDDLYVTANYKETQLTNVRVGQRVDIEVDTFPGARFQGRIQSIMAGTGSVFSLIPTENATGNFVKLVQRIPIKIVFTDHDPRRQRLRVGMSVEPTIHVEDP